MSVKQCVGVSECQCVRESGVRESGSSAARSWQPERLNLLSAGCGPNCPIAILCTITNIQNANCFRTELFPPKQVFQQHVAGSSAYDPLLEMIMGWKNSSLSITSPPHRITSSGGSPFEQENSGQQLPGSTADAWLSDGGCPSRFGETGRRRAA